jgi:hypothetical protein
MIVVARLVVVLRVLMMETEPIDPFEHLPQ